MNPGRGRVGRVIDRGFRGFGFDSRDRVQLLVQKQVLFHGWPGMVETQAMYH